MPVVPPPPIAAPSIQIDTSPKRSPAGQEAAIPSRIKVIALAIAAVYCACLVIALIGGLLGVAEGETPIARFIIVLIGGPIIATASTTVYFIPTIVAYMRQHRQALPIAILNLCVGWMVLGWIGSLVWSVTSDRQT